MNLEFFSLVETVPSWLVNWLTPVWLLSVGALLGLVMLLVLWVAVALLSRLPGLGQLADNPVPRYAAATILSIVFLSGLGPALWAYGPTLSDDSAATSNLWLIGWLVPLALVLWAVSLGCVVLVSRRTVAEIPMAIREGVLWPVTCITLCLAGYAILGASIVREPVELLTTLGRIPAVGTQELPAVSVPGPGDGMSTDLVDPPEHEISVRLINEELQELIFESDQKLVISPTADELGTVRTEINVNASEPTRWVKLEQTINPFREEMISTLYVRNYGPEDANLVITTVTALAHPQVVTIPITAVSVVIFYLFYIMVRSAMPKVSAVALATFKSETAQPFYLIVIAIGLVALVLFIFIPYNTLGEDIKVLKDSGLTLIMVLAVISAIWAASNSIADEIDGRTALTVLSKPIGRRSFIVGKFYGIASSTALLYILLGLALLVVTAYKPIYDAKESSEESPLWQMCHLEMFNIVPGLALGFMSTLVLTALSVAISTRLPMVANFLICFSIYVLGHLTPLLVKSSVAAEQFEPVVFVAQFIATLLPNLENFNIQAAIAGGAQVPFAYLGWALIYCVIYSFIAMLLSLILFEDRDLA